MEARRLTGRSCIPSKAVHSTCVDAQGARASGCHRQPACATAPHMTTTRTLSLAIGFTLALSLLGVAAMLERRQTVRLEETAALVTRTHEVQANLNRLLSVVQDIEAASRGYVLTG